MAECKTDLDDYIPNGNNGKNLNKSGKKNIIKNILFTVAYYNVLEFPFTSFEIWRYLIDFRHKKESCSLEEVLEGLDYLESKKIIKNVKSFWVINNKDYLADQRIAKQKISVSKINQMTRWIKLISKLPYIRAIFVTGALAMKRAKRGSDWDIIVITKRNRIWLGRLIISFVLQLFGKRRHRWKIKNRFCLNHFLTESSLILEENNEFSSNEVVFCLPLYGKNVYQKFQQLNQHQINLIRPNYQKDVLPNYFSVKESKFWEATKRGIEKFFEFFKIDKLINDFFKKVMIKKIQKNPKTYLAGSDIRYDDGALIFLPVPRRRQILQKTMEEFRSLNKEF